MKPRLQDVLFLDKDCKHLLDHDNQVFSKKNYNLIDNLCPEVKVSKEGLEDLIQNELKGKYYPGFVKYFNINYKDSVSRASKHAQKSIEARIKGNALFAQKEHNIDIHLEIWKLYSKSITWAPIKSKELVLAYECRSNLLLHFKKYCDCIKDIDKALSITKFDLLIVKLLCRKMTCFVAINKDIVEKERLWKKLEYHFDKINAAFKDEKFTKMFEQAKIDVKVQPDNKIKKKANCTPLTTFASMPLTLNKDRNLTADRDLKAGEVVIVTKPTIASVNPNQFYVYCSHCLSFMWAGIPCDECSLSMYCSEECKDTAWEKYHILECKVSPHIDFRDPVFYSLKNSIKMFIMGVREFRSIAKLSEKVREVEQLKDNPNFMKRDKFFDSEFLNFYSLSNMHFCDSCNLSNFVKNTCFLMAYLTQSVGDIFGKDVASLKGKELAKDEDFVCSAFVMLKIMMLCELHMDYPCGRTYIKCSKHGSKEECISKRCGPVGNIFYFFRGLMEQSCNPNVSVCQTRSGRILYFCTQPIKKMETIKITPTVPFYYMNREERHMLQSDLLPIYDACQCIACVKDWPPFRQDWKKYAAKFERRSSRVPTKGTKLMLDKYFDKLRLIGDDPGKFLEIFDRDVDKFRELARDTNEVVSICGQPSFASSLMISMLCQAFCSLYGDISVQFHIPVKC